MSQSKKAELGRNLKFMLIWLFEIQIPFWTIVESHCWHLATTTIKEKKLAGVRCHSVLNWSGEI